ncbi:hypothetical protein BKA82DRAFT_305796 [Pisolithus tinctorius]|uniref:Uncharacterized protein n=1 Tax=Pisolithus tinctorius Marx 270 TaxID=870435 RepID=A0A0C3P6S6_PISTI|nr:hypothetical protein BKA82DRAFT_305796 [Pisolithus tinctorius]KIO09040.1 hypothetical protein M404DRAFT_305796 [Pisolithus tinctorius Marx 270]
MIATVSTLRFRPETRSTASTLEILVLVMVPKRSTPEVQRRVHAELDGIIGKGVSDFRRRATITVLAACTL